MLSSKRQFHDESRLDLDDTKNSTEKKVSDTSCDPAAVVNSRASTSTNVDSPRTAGTACSPSHQHCKSMLKSPLENASSPLSYSPTPTIRTPPTVSSIIPIGSVDIPYYSTFTQKVLDLSKHLGTIKRLLPRHDDDLFVPSAIPIRVILPDDIETNSTDSFDSSSFPTIATQERDESFPVPSEAAPKEDSSENPEAQKMRQNIQDILRIQKELAPSSNGSCYSLVSSLRIGSLCVVVAFFLLSMCIVIVYHGVSTSSNGTLTVLLCGIIVNVVLFLAFLLLAYAFFWRMDAQYYLEALDVVLFAARDFQLCQSVKKIDHPKHFKASVFLGFESRAVLQNLISSVLLASYRVESLNELLEMREAEARQQSQDPLPSFHVWQGSTDVDRTLAHSLGGLKLGASKKESFRRTDLGSASVYKRSATGELMFSGQSSTGHQFFPDMESFDTPSTTRGGQSEAVAGGEIGPMVVYIICKLFLDDLRSRRVNNMDSTVLSNKLREMTSTFSDAVTHIAASTGGVVVGMELDSAIITFNAFLPMPAVSAMSTAYKAAVSLDMELIKRKKQLNCDGMFNISWGMVLQQGRLIVGNGGTEYLKQPYVYGPELEFGYQVVELCRLLQCTVLSLAPNAQSNRSVQIIPVDVIGVAAAHTMFLYEIKMRNGEDMRALEDKMIKSLLLLYNHNFDNAVRSLLDIKDANHNAKRMCYLAAYFRRLARQKKLQVPHPYFRAGPSWEFIEILALQAAMSSNLSKSILESNAVYHGTSPTDPSEAGEEEGRIMEMESDIGEHGICRTESHQSNGGASEVVKSVDASESKGALIPVSATPSAKNSVSDNRLLPAGNKLSSNSGGGAPGTKNDPIVRENPSSHSIEGSSGGRNSKIPIPSSSSPSSSLPHFASVNQESGLADLLELEGSSFSEEPAFSKENPPSIFSVQESFNQSSSMRFKIPSLQSSIVVGSLTRSQMVSARNAQRAVVVTGTEASSMSAQAPSRVLKFSLGDLIAKGRGGTEVYRGLHPNGRIVAIKKVPIVNQSVDLKAAERELETLATLKHPNILRYIASCYTDADFYIIMEFVSGGSLTDLIRNFGPLPESAIHRYTMDSLAGLEYLHRRGIVHRDISTNNIMVTIDGECKIADFGGAFLASDNQRTAVSAEGPYGFQWSSTFLEMQCASSEHSLNMSLMGHPQTVSARPTHASIYGTPIYMSPQAARGIVDAKNDIWSLGIAVCYCSTGCIPFKNEDLVLPSKIFLEALSNGDVRPVIPSNQLDEGLESFVRLCLQEELEDRPSASQLLKNPYILQGNSRKPIRSSG